MNHPWETIEGETPIDPSHLKDRTIRTRAELNRAEAENVRKAHVKYFAGKPSRRLAPFDFSWFCRLHVEMFRDVWKWAGVLRTEDVNIGVPWAQVSSQLMALVGDLAYWKTSTETSKIEQAVRLHHRAAAIHPFCNGNGRWARMLANIWLYTHDQPLVKWPEATMSGTSPVRQKYLRALQEADKNDYDLLIAIHRRFLE